MGIINKININSGYTPRGKFSWSTKLCSEFLGTIFLAWMIGILGVTFSGGQKLEVILSGGTTRGTSQLVVGWWVALDILICLAVFSRWSCDLNPAVTTYRIIAGQNSITYGLTKIGIQICGGLVAGLCIWSTQAISGAISNSPADQVIGNMHQARAAFAAMSNHAGIFNKIFQDTGFTKNQLINDPVLWQQLNSFGLPNFNITHNFRELQSWSALTTGLDVHGIDSRVWDNFIAFTGEFLGVFILLWPIFSKELKSPLVKDVLVVAIVGFGVAALLELGTVSWNPARLLATNWIYDLLKPGYHAMAISPAYLVGEMVAPFALFYGQKFIKRANIVWERWLKIGVVNDLSQHLDEGELDRIEAKHKKAKAQKKHQR